MESSLSKEKMKLKKYDVALATRNFEIELFWKRSLFFWGFIASAFIGYATLIKNTPSLAVIVACFGFVCSIAWSFVNRGSKRWQENWEIFVAELEDEVTGKLFKERRYKENKHSWLSSRNFSVSKLTIALSDFTVFIWASLMLYHLSKVFPLTQTISKEPFLTLAVIGSFAFAIVMLWKGRSSK